MDSKKSKKVDKTNSKTVGSKKSKSKTVNTTKSHSVESKKAKTMGNAKSGVTNSKSGSVNAEFSSDDLLEAEDKDSVDIDLNNAAAARTYFPQKESKS